MLLTTHFSFIELFLSTIRVLTEQRKFFTGSGTRPTWDSPLWAGLTESFVIPWFKGWNRWLLITCHTLCRNSPWPKSLKTWEKLISQRNLRAKLKKEFIYLEREIRYLINSLGRRQKTASMSNSGIGGSYREMLDDYRDVDIDELMKGLVHYLLQNRWFTRFSPVFDNWSCYTAECLRTGL